MRERLGRVPREPGVYLFKDGEGRVLYVGKAKVLRSRLRSYFQAPERLLPKVRALMQRVRDFDYIVTTSEVEALMLENNLIKAYHPKYNILMRDDKSYPYLKVTVGEEYPRMLVVREKKDGVSRYFGPFSDAGALKETVRTLAEVFPIRTCRRLRRGQRPCLNRDLGRCLAPCSGQVDRGEYLRMVDSVIRFMEGDTAGLLAQLEEEMRSAARDLQFERAAQLRDAIRAVRRLGEEKQQVVLPTPLELDAVALLPVQRETLAMVFKVRQGKVVAKDTFWLREAMGEEPEQVLGYFLQQYYGEQAAVPREILVPVSPGGREVLERWLGERAGSRPRIVVPRRGLKARLLAMAVENARLLAAERLGAAQADQQALVELAQALGLEVVPQRIEGFDISHLGGEGVVGAMVVAAAGRPDKGAYRRFRLSREVNDDYRAMREVVRRRVQQGREGNPAFLPWPDLILVDGGAGQVTAAREALQEAGVDIPVVGLAKKREEVYRAG
ncbi:MAG: excinuclease ABC subunit UvrC, partial [Syntrophomonadaceae bacterium]|nr:excinuclease ABC subunit UvrC [Syntrophomonadaceae bacterium]